MLISENFQQSVIVPPECVNSTRWKKSFSFFAGMVWKTLQSHSGCLKNVLADNCANLGSKQVYKKTAHGAHLALFLFPRRHAWGFFSPFLSLHTHAQATWHLRKPANHRVPGMSQLSLLGITSWWWVTPWDLETVEQMPKYTMALTLYDSSAKVSHVRR